jgi:c(7)-type cytochrome triheme protein
MKRILTTAALALALLAAGAAQGDDLPNLPHALPLPRGADSPGEVTFRHDSHVDTAKPACVACHPRLFGILGRSGQSKPRPVTHAAMEKGEACGACHGEAAFGLDDCTMCHAQ